MWTLVVAALAYVPLLQPPHVHAIRFTRTRPLVAQQETVKALADAKVAAEAVTEDLADAAAELEGLELATAEELGLTKEELEIFMDAADEATPAASSPVEAMADLVVAQEDVTTALQDGFDEFEQIEKEIAAELGVTVAELECVEDSSIPELSALLPEGCVWGGTY